MPKLCNGVVSPRNCYNYGKRQGLIQIIQNVRKKLITEFDGVDHDRMIFLGERFNDNEEVIARLESVNQEAIKNVGWEQAVRSALIDCMNADYYYTFEKEY